MRIGPDKDGGPLVGGFPGRVAKPARDGVG
jgi:hypothetical protein